jgi:hypothetical protein
LRVKAAVVGALVAVSLLAPARGEHKVVEDGNDTKGRADISKVRMENDRPRKWIFKTFRVWKVNDFFEKGYFVVHLDTIGDKDFDYYVFVRAKRKRLSAALWRERDERDDVLVAHVNARKIAARLMGVSVPFNKLRFGKKRVNYRWLGRSIWSGNQCRRLCIDRAPNKRLVAEPLVPTP